MSRPRSSESGVTREAPLFAALGDDTRLALVARLCKGGPQSITGLTAGAAVTRQAITKHLAILAAAGVVHDVRRGRERIWDLDTNRLAEAGRWLEQISSQWDEALARLKKFVEE
jgi:DNA-binding transcriptional ArsR family regulator